MSGLKKESHSWRLPAASDISLRTAARDFTEMGYRIHRCYEEGYVDASGLKKGKNPIGKWKGLWNQPRTQAELHEMFSPGGFYDRSRMIALVVPEGMVVFDIDEDADKGFNAEKTLAAFCEQFGLEIDEEGYPIGVPIVRTPSGGFHLYFTLPVGMIAKNWTAVSGKFVVPGIDLRTSGGGIVLIPPSVRQNGNRYEWVRWFSEIPRCNTGLVDALTPPEVPVSPPGVHRPYVPSPDGLHPYMSAVLRNTIEQLEQTGKGGRNDALNTAALTLGHWVAGGEISEAEAKASIRGTSLWAELVRDDGQATCEATLKSGFERGLQEPRNVPPPKPEYDFGRYHTPEMNAAFEQYGKTSRKAAPAAAIEPTPLVKELQQERADRASQWFNDWFEGQPIDGTRAAMLLAPLTDREHATKNFRVREVNDGEGLVLMCAYRDLKTGYVCGTQEMLLRPDGSIIDTRYLGLASRGICTLRQGRCRTMLLGEDLRLLSQTANHVRDLGRGPVGIAMFQSPAALRAMTFAGMPKSVLLALERTPENEALTNFAAKTNAPMGYNTSVAWLESAEPEGAE